MTSAVSMGSCSPMMNAMQARSSDPAKLLSKVDTNGDRSIDKVELKTFLDFVSEKTGTTALDADKVLSSVDTDGDGAVSGTELEENGAALFDQLREQLMSAQLSAPPAKPDSSEMFAKIDSDGDGAISKSEIETFAGARADAGQGPSADEILARDDSDGDGSISLAEFEQAAKHKPGPPPAGDSTQQVDRLIASLLKQYSTTQSSTTTLSAAA